jgi:hypothetical protein
LWAPNFTLTKHVTSSFTASYCRCEA